MANKKILCIKGGLGNQLFEYCRYQQLTDAGYKVFIHYDRQQLNVHGGTLLDECFDVQLPPISIPTMVITLLLKGIRKTGLFSQLFDEDHPKCLLIDDYSQDLRYISKALSLLPFRNNIRQKVDSIWLRNIENSPCSVAVHVRRGDYLHPINASNFGICPEEYYKNAIKFIRQCHPEAELFFFSDDINYCRNHLKFDNSNYVEHKENIPDWSDLYLMTRCHHHIIANSTFSFWGAFLSRQADCINIYPRRWFANAEWTTPNIFPKEWITM